MTKYLTKNNVIVIHKNLINKFGGLDENLLDSSIMRSQSWYYNSIYEEESLLFAF